MKSTKYIHSGHMAIINEACRIGRLVIGVLNDEAVSCLKRYPLIPFTARKTLFENLAGVFKENCLQLKPYLSVGE